MTLIRLLLLSAAVAISPPSRATEGEPEPGLSDYAILTPAVEGRFYVLSGFDLTTMVNPFFSVASIADRSSSKALRALVERERYDPAARLADRLAEALGRAGFSAVQEPVARRPAGSVQSLAWGDVPEAPRGNVMIDVTIRWICLCSDVAFSKLYPAISLGWRLLGPRQELLEPTRNLVYVHNPAYQKRKKTPAGTPPPDPSAIPPVAVVSETCGFTSIKSVEEDPRALWRCLDEAMQGATDRLVFDLKKTVR